MKHLRKKILFQLQNGPYSLAKAQEALDVILMASTFEQDISLFFLNDGVFLLKDQQNPIDILTKNFTAAYQALSLYGIEKIYVDAASLSQRGLTAGNLMIPGMLVSANEISAILHQQDAIISF